MPHGGRGRLHRRRTCAGRRYTRTVTNPVPGMPLGSLGMENEGGRREPYDVIAFGQDSGRTAFSHQG